MCSISSRISYRKEWNEKKRYWVWDLRKHSIIHINIISCNFNFVMVFFSVLLVYAVEWFWGALRTKEKHHFQIDIISIFFFCFFFFLFFVRRGIAKGVHLSNSLMKTLKSYYAKWLEYIGGKCFIWNNSTKSVMSLSGGIFLVEFRESIVSSCLSLSLSLSLSFFVVKTVHKNGETEKL